MYIGTTANSLYCLNRSTGGTVMTINHTGGTYGVSSSPALFKGILAYSSDNGNLFVVEQKIDEFPPQINITYPVNNANDVPLDVNVTVRFTEQVDNSTITSSSIQLRSAAGPVDAVYGYDREKMTAWLSPSRPDTLSP